MASVAITVYDEERADLFVSHQRTIDTLLTLPHNDESRAEMLEEFRRISPDDDTTRTEIELFNRKYHSNNAIRWYTRSSPLTRTIGRALRSSDVDMMFKFRYYLKDLYTHLDGIYRQTHYFRQFSGAEKFYRGQALSKKCLHSFQQLIGHIISINTFFSTTNSLQVALFFANSFPNNDDCLRVIFCIENENFIPNPRPYANISWLSRYPDEEEVLFAMGSIFRIRLIEDLDQTNPLPVIYLQMIDPATFNWNHPL